MKEEKIDFVQIGDGKEARDLADAFVKKGSKVSIIGFREGIGQYFIHKTPEIEYFQVGKVNLRAMPHTVQLLDIRDYTDPLEWEKTLDSVINNEDIDELIKKVGYCSNLTKRPLKEYGRDYVTFKKVLKEKMAPEYLFLSKDCQMYCPIRAFDKEDTRTLENIISLFYQLTAVEIIDTTRIRLENDKLSGAEELNETGDKLNEAREYKKALSYLEQALQLSPRFCLAWINKGIALKNLGRLDEAIACYDHVIEKINLEYKKAWYNKANAFFVKKDFDKAKECVDRALEIDPTYPHALALGLKLTLFRKVIVNDKTNL